ncbi:hypothetical protein PIPA1_36870 [Pelosinus sp. IPA-1]|nr:hypothetical protein PIPA1_36870 [Pelosinus sp. IPA-1]
MDSVEQILRNAIAVICDADFNARFPYTRKIITVEDLVEMGKRCEGSE